MAPFLPAHISINDITEEIWRGFILGYTFPFLPPPGSRWCFPPMNRRADNVNSLYPHVLLESRTWNCEKKELEQVRANSWTQRFTTNDLRFMRFNEVPIVSPGAGTHIASNGEQQQLQHLNNHPSISYLRYSDRLPFISLWQRSWKSSADFDALLNYRR